MVKKPPMLIFVKENMIVKFFSILRSFSDTNMYISYKLK